MDAPAHVLSDLLAMTAMRIASNGRAIARVTAELDLSRVTGEYLANFAYDLNPIERERVAREINLDLNNLHRTRSYVVCEATDRHPDYLLSYEIVSYNDHARVEFTLTAAVPPPLNNFNPEWLRKAAE